MKFYKKDNLWLVGNIEPMPAGSCRMHLIEDTKVWVKELGSYSFLIEGVEVTDIQKSETPNDNYTDLTEFKTSVSDFFLSSDGSGGASEVSIVDENNKPTNVQNPFPSDGDSVYIKDVDFANSDFTNWVGDQNVLFESPFSTSIVNSTSNNPKQIVLSFNRTLIALQIGLGENNGSDFSNVKISLLGSGGAARGILDESSNNTKKTSLNAEFENEVFNSLLIEFYTSDPVSLSNITIQKARYNTTQIQGKKPNGEFSTVNTNFLGNLLVSLDEQKDAFGRLKTAEPFTIFDNSLTSSIVDTLFWANLSNGTANGQYNRTTSNYDLNVVSNGDYLIRQTKQRFKYQPAKSHEFFITGLWNTEINVRKRAGLVDYDNVTLPTISNIPQNGIFFENNNGVLSWNIANNGTITESANQDNWNIDSLDGNGSSGFVLDINATNILTGQFEWLGVGVVLVGFATGGGEVAYCHAFTHASVSGFVDVYMRTANLPISYEITSFGGVGTLKQICCSVISGGGFNPVGNTNGIQNPSSVSVGNNDTEILCGIRLKEDNFEYTVDPKSISILTTSNGNTTWVLCVNPTYTDVVTWSDIPNSVCQEAFNNGGEVTDLGIIIERGSLSNNLDNLAADINTAVRIGKDLVGNLDELWLVITALGNESYYGTLNYKELI